MPKDVLHGYGSVMFFDLLGIREEVSAPVKKN